MYFIVELGFPQMEATPLYVDNKSLITLAQQLSGDHKRCKHFLAHINYMIEQVDRIRYQITEPDNLDSFVDVCLSQLGASSWYTSLNEGSMGLLDTELMCPMLAVAMILAMCPGCERYKLSLSLRM